VLLLDDETVRGWRQLFEAEGIVSCIQLVDARANNVCHALLKSTCFISDFKITRSLN
jgi:hypothetical protein